MEQGFSILIVEDDVNLALTLQDILQEEDYTVAVANNGQTALNLCAEKVFDLAFVDIRLPDISGMKLIDEISKISPETEYIISTGYASLDTAVEAVRQKRIIAYETKPVDMGHLLSLARQVAERKRATEALGQSELQYRLLAENVTDIIFTLDMNLRFTYLSPSFTRLTNYSVEETMAMPIEELFTASSLEVILKTFEEELTIEKMEQKDLIRPRTMELEVRRKDGSMVWVEARATLLHEQDHQTIGVLGIARDITERRGMQEALRHSEKYFRSLIENSLDGILVLDNEGTIHYEGPSARRVLGYKAGEQIGMSGFQFIHPDDIPNVTEEFANLLQNAGTSRRIELRGKNKDGSWHTLEVVATNLLNNSAVRGVVINFRDITARKKAEGELKQSYERLKRSIESTIQVMVKMAEIRDPYTAGHQQRVAHLACAIASEMGLSQDQIDRIRTAAIIHDIGKLYVPAEILSKPGKLSEGEFSLIKAHSKLGYEIMKTIDLPCSVAETVLHHHERMDGSGYPDGRKGDDILLEARILGVADVVEAMSSHRPYRPALGIDKAIEEISQKKGILYDPDVADACLRLLSEKGFKLE